jgi:hypothetical protein
MKRSLGTELCTLLGPEGGTGIFIFFDKKNPFSVDDAFAALRIMRTRP